MKNNNVMIVLVMGFAAYMLYDPAKATPVTVRAEPAAAVVDYGSGFGATSDATCVGDQCIVPIDGMAAVKATMPSAFGDIPKDTEVAGPVGSAPPPAQNTEPLPEIEQHVFPVTSHDSSGCAVAIAPDKLLSVYHVVKYNGARVQVGDKWVTTKVTHPTGVNDLQYDGAYLSVPGGSFPRMKIRAPFYYEPVTLYGLKTKVRQRGFVSSYRTVSLLPETKGVESGDSGGAIVGDDGCLVGLISGVEHPIVRNVPKNNRIVTFTRMDYLAEQLPPDMRATSGGNESIPKPVGDVNPGAPPAPAVNNNQTSQVTDRPGYAYTYQWRSRRHR